MNYGFEVGCQVFDGTYEAAASNERIVQRISSLLQLLLDWVPFVACCKCVLVQLAPLQDSER